MTRGYISIGSNINKDEHVPASLLALRQSFGELTISSIYESEPVGFIGDSFYNLVVGFDSDLEVKAVTKQLRQIELDNGRTRDSRKFAARTLDLDLILYGNLIINDGRLQIPRNEIEHYAFVLEPLAEIAPTLKHPVNRLTYAELWQQFDKTDLKQKRITPSWSSTK
ncbi:MAG: 2-amino-4-hydroxy-6-hydroxymethyldihydropteridine diphosphokinase [Methylococcaceae bacterium]